MSQNSITGQHRSLQGEVNALSKKMTSTCMTFFKKENVEGRGVKIQGWKCAQKRNGLDLTTKFEISMI